MAIKSKRKSSRIYPRAELVRMLRRAVERGEGHWALRVAGWLAEYDK